MRALGIILALMLIIAGCHAVATWEGNSTYGADSYAAECRASAEFQDVIREGMSLQEAVRILENRGFAKRAEPGPLAQVAEDGTESLTLIRQVNSGRLEIKICSQQGKVKYFRTAHYSDTIHMHLFQEATRDDVLRFAALQMPVDDAIRALERQGFKRIQRSKYFDGRIGRPASVEDAKWMILEKCFRSNGFPSTVEVRILPENGKIAELEADTLPIAVL